MQVESGRSVKLYCSIDAKPSVTSVRWIRNNGIVGTDYELELNQVSVGDAGAYTCSAENDVGEKKQELELDVLYAPQVSPYGVSCHPQGVARAVVLSYWEYMSRLMPMQ